MTYALDLAVIVPATLLGGVLLLRRVAVGYQITFALLGIVVLLGPSIVLATWFHSRAGLDFSAAEAVGPVAGFLLVALPAVAVLVAVLRRLGSDAVRQRLSSESDAAMPRPALGA